MTRSSVIELILNSETSLSALWNQLQENDNRSISPAYDFHILQAAVEQKQGLVKDGVAAPLLTAAAAVLHAAAPPTVVAAAPAAVTAAVSDAVSPAVSPAVSSSLPAFRSRIYPTGVSCGTYFL